MYDKFKSVAEVHPTSSSVGRGVWIPERALTVCNRGPEEKEPNVLRIPLNYKAVKFKVRGCHKLQFTALKLFQVTKSVLK